MKFSITLSRDEIWCLDQRESFHPGCVSQGKTNDEAVENIREAIKLCLEVKAEKGLLYFNRRRLAALSTVFKIRITIYSYSEVRIDLCYRGEARATAKSLVQGPSRHLILT